jgi:hypothetical protein
MFFHAHTYFSIKRNNGVAPPLRIFGALLADSALTGVVSWTDLHDKDTLEAFTSQLRSADAQLGPGLMDHYELDLRSHDAFDGDTGYAFSHQTQQLRELVARACGFDAPEQARGIAHNFIEAGVDIHLLSYDSQLQGELRRALDAVDIEPVAQYVAKFFRADAAKTLTKLTTYRDFMMKYDLQDQKEWVKLWEEIIYMLLKKEANKHAVGEALRLAVELTAKDYQKVIAV